MRRFVFVMIVIVVGVGLVAAAMMLRPASTPVQTPAPQALATTTSESVVSATATDVACTLLADMEAPPDIRVALAVDTMYEEMPLFKTPVAIVATEEKPFKVGCIEAGD